MISMFELRQRPAELGHAIAAGRLLLADPEDGMLVGVEGHRLAVRLQIAPEHLKVRKGAFRRHEAQRHQAAGGIVHEHQKRAGRATILKPAVLAAIDLDQLAQVLAAMPRLVKALALGPRQPEPSLDHPGAQCLARHPQSVALLELLSRQGWAEICIMLPHKGQNRRSEYPSVTVVARPTAFAGDQTSRSVCLEALHEPVDLPAPEPKLSGGLCDADPPILNANDCLQASQLSCAYPDHRHRSTSP